MMEGELSESPPLARGAYTIDFDNLDEFADPFSSSAPKKMAVANSPVSAGAPPAFPATNNNPSPQKNASPQKSASPKKAASQKNGSPLKSVENSLSSPKKGTPKKGPSGSPKHSKGSPQIEQVAPLEPIANTTFSQSPNKTNDTLEVNHTNKSVNNTRETTFDSSEVTFKPPPAFDTPTVAPEPVALDTDTVAIDTGPSQSQDAEPEAELPVPRGAYTIDFDNLDEFSDPFGGSVKSKPKATLSASPKATLSASPKATLSASPKATLSASPTKIEQSNGTSAPSGVNMDLSAAKLTSSQSAAAAKLTSSQPAAAETQATKQVKGGKEETDGACQSKKKKPGSNFRKFRKNLAKEAAEQMAKELQEEPSVGGRGDNQPGLTSNTAVGRGDNQPGLTSNTAVSFSTNNHIIPPSQTGPAFESGEGHHEGSQGRQERGEGQREDEVGTDSGKGSLLESEGEEKGMTSEPDDFQDAQEEVEPEKEEEFVPAKDYMFSEAALDELEKKGDARNEFAMSTKARQSLYQRFDPLVMSAMKDKKKEAVARGDLIFMDTPPANQKETEVPSTMKHPAARRLEENVTGVMGSSPVLRENAAPLYGAPSPRKEVDMLLGGTPTFNSRPTGHSGGEVYIGAQTREPHDPELQTKVMAQEAQLLAKDKELAEWHRRHDTLHQLSLQLSQLVDGMQEQARKEVAEVNKDNEMLTNRLMENEDSKSFLHHSYEKLRKSYEELKSSYQSMTEQMNRERESRQEVTDTLHRFKMEVGEKLAGLDQTMESNTVLEQEKAQLVASRKKLELQVSSLERSLSQKTQENKELSDICDELISKVHSD